MAILNFVATSTAAIYPSRFVKLSAANEVIHATAATDVPVGISHEGTKSFDSNVAAAAKEPIAVYSVGEICLVEAGGTISAGDLLEAGNAGTAVPLGSTGTRHYAAIALEGGAIGERIRCLVLPPVKVKLS